MMTDWGNRCSPSAHDLLDEFLEAVRQHRGEPGYMPDKLTRQVWVGQAEKWAAARKGKPGFWSWALGVHQRAADKERTPMCVSGPLSLSYLWDQYRETPEEFRPCPHCFQIGGHAEDCPRYADAVRQLYGED